MEEITDVDVIDQNNSIDRIDTATVLHNIEAQGQIFDALQSYVKKHMIEGQDFGKIPGCDKPSLWKPGAEKINFMFNFVPKYVILSETESNSEYTYKIRTDLYNKNNAKFMGSGVGYASTKEKKFSIAPANTVLKMSKKRSYIDATLSSTMASFIFTQDVIEEDDKPEDATARFKNTNNSAETKYASNREYFEKFDWSKVDLQSVPEVLEWGKNPKTGKSMVVKNAEIITKLYFYACELMPKEEVSQFYLDVAGKKYGFTHEHAKIIAKALISIDDDKNKSKGGSKEELREAFEQAEFINEEIIV